MEWTYPILGGMYIEHTLGLHHWCAKIIQGDKEEEDHTVIYHADNLVQVDRDTLEIQYINYPYTIDRADSEPLTEKEFNDIFYAAYNASRENIITGLTPQIILRNEYIRNKYSFSDQYFYIKSGHKMNNRYFADECIVVEFSDVSPEATISKRYKVLIDSIYEEDGCSINYIINKKQFDSIFEETLEKIKL